MGAVRRVDEFQRRHTAVGMPLAVIYKFFDDQGPYLAALLAYYGFLSLFPLLLLLVSALGTLLEGDPELQQQVLHSALRKFPVIGDQLQENIRSLRGSGLALVVGVLGSLYGGLGVAQAAQHALNKIWGVPRHKRPNPLLSRLKSLLFLGLGAVGLVVTTALAAAAQTAHVFGVDLGGALRAGTVLAVILLNASLLLLTYRLLLQHEVPAGRLWVAALVGACVWQGLQWSGAYVVGNVIQGAGATYGMFGMVLGLLAWLYLGALVFVLTAEASAVRARRLWPRSLLTPFTDRVRLSPADRRAYTSYATAQSFKGFEKVTVYFHPQPDRNDGAR